MVLHGAGSAKESHHDYARAAVALGMAAICFDARGHGDSEGRMDARVIDDVVTMAVHLRLSIGDRRAPLALRSRSSASASARLKVGAAAAGFWHGARLDKGRSF